MRKTLNVVSCTATNKGSYLLKVVSNGTPTEISVGIYTPGKRETFYIFVTNDVPISTKLDLEMSEFEIHKKDFEFVDEETGEERLVELKYLQLIEE
jgi:hypothetical protein